jgi:hypothetical protein
MSDYKIIPSKYEYKSAPNINQRVSVSLDNTSKQLNEYDRTFTVDLVQVYDDERQLSTVFRPTFKVTNIYFNAYTGTTNYPPFRDNMYYVNPIDSVYNSVWVGFPQYYEFDFLRLDVLPSHINYVSKSAYTYNWTYYLSYPYENNYETKMGCIFNTTQFNWIAKDGIPFVLNSLTQNGDELVSFECISPHGLSVGEFVELSISYGGHNIFQVYSLGNDLYQSESNVFNIYNVGYTGNTFLSGNKGTFKRVINSENVTETKSKYYIKKHKILTNTDDIIVTRTGFENNPFPDNKRYELSSLTPNNISRISQRHGSASYTVTTKHDIDISDLLDNQKRPITEIFLTLINKGYSGYFNKPINGVAIKRGWEFNLTSTTNFWWDDNNVDSRTSILTNSYVKNVNGVSWTFYYNDDLKKGDIIDGDFCEWNDYEQVERVISKCNHKLKYNQSIFITQSATTNSEGFYYQPHHPVTLRTFSSSIETGNISNTDQVPGWSYFSVSDQEFRWRDLYSYGFIDAAGVGVDYPYLNKSHYPFKNVIFRLVPEGTNINEVSFGTDTPVKPLIDGCE